MSAVEEESVKVNDDFVPRVVLFSYTYCQTFRFMWESPRISLGLTELQFLKNTFLKFICSLNSLWSTLCCPKVYVMCYIDKGWLIDWIIIIIIILQCNKPIVKNVLIERLWETS